MKLNFDKNIIGPSEGCFNPLLIEVFPRAVNLITLEQT